MIAEFILCQHPHLLLANFIYLYVLLIYQPCSGTSGCLLFIALMPHSSEWRNLAFSSWKPLHALLMQSTDLAIVRLSVSQTRKKFPKGARAF